MTGKTKRRSLRCGGRPKADFGSVFTSYIAPVLGVAGAVADSAVANHQNNVNAGSTKLTTNTNTNAGNSGGQASTPKVDTAGLSKLNAPNPVPSTPSGFSQVKLPADSTKAPVPANRLGGRHKCWIGAAIGAATSIASSIFGNAAKKKQERLARSQKDWQDSIQEASAMTEALNNSSDYQEDYLRQFRTAARLGKTLGANKIYITDGGDATKVDNNTYLLQGGSHEDINETGQTGIGINVGGNQVEAEGGEVAQKKGNSLRIFSAQPILGGMSPAQAVLRGYNKDDVFAKQQAFKKRNGLNDDGSKAQWGNSVGTAKAIQKSTKYGTRSPRSMWNSAKTPLSYTPIVGTAMDGYEYIRRPTVRNFIPFGIGIAADIAGLKWMTGTGKATTTFERALKSSNHIRSKKAPKGLVAGTLNADDAFANYMQNKKSLGGRAQARVGTWVKPTYNTSKYRGTDRARKQIAKWEGSDFAGQNAQFHGDAIGAKERELRQFMGKAYNYLNDNQRDALLSYYYNLVPKTFRGQMTKYRDALINAQTEQEYNDTLNNMRESINVGANRKGMGGLRNRRAVERNWFGYSYANPVQEQVNKITTQVPDAIQVAKPIVQEPIQVNPQEGYVPSPTSQRLDIPQGRIYDYIKSNIMKRQLRYGGRAKAEIGTERTYNAAYTPEPRSKADEYDFPLFSLYHALVDRFDDKNPALITGVAPTAGRGRGFGKGKTKTLASRRNLARNNKPTVARPSYTWDRTTVNTRSSYVGRGMTRINTHGIKGTNEVPVSQPYGNSDYFYYRGTNIPRVNDGYEGNLRFANTTDRVKAISDKVKTTFDRVKANDISSKYSKAKKSASRLIDKLSDPGTYRNKSFEEIYNPEIGAYQQHNVYTGLKPWAKKTIVGGFGTGAALMGIGLGKEYVSYNKNNPSPISPYIAKPTQPATKKAQANSATKPVTTVSKKQVSKAKSQTKPTIVPKTSKVVSTKLYGLNDNETKTINGQTYVRRGNQVFNTTTKVRYDYANGKYTGRNKSYGVGDYSHVGKNFNDAFDAARAAGASQFRYNAGRYNQYTTVKETDAKKEALNRRVGANRVAKALGGYSRPVKGMRPKAELGDEIKWLGYPYPLPRKWDFTNIKLGSFKPSILSSNYPYGRGEGNIARQLESTDNYRDFSIYRTQLPENNPYVQALTKATGHTWQDIKDNNTTLRYDGINGYNHFTPTEDKNGYKDEGNVWKQFENQPLWKGAEEVIHYKPTKPSANTNIKTDTIKTEDNKYQIKDNKLGMSPSTGDWIGLGVDTLAGLAGGFINYNAAKDMYIPGRAPIVMASKLPTNYNIAPQVEEVKRMRDRVTRDTYNNTSSSVAALNRANNVNLNALSELSKLWATKENEENKMLTQDALNQQSVAETNIRNEMVRESEIAQYKNAQNQAKYDAINASLSGLAQAYNNFYTNATKRYEDEVAMRTYLAGAENATPYRMLSMGVPISQGALQGIYGQIGSITDPGSRPERKDYDSNASWSRAVDKWEKDNTLYRQRGEYRNMVLSRLNKKSRLRLGIR